MKIRLEPIMPKKKVFDPARYKDEFERARQETQTGILDDFKKTAATWSHKPTWYSTRRGNVIYIGTKDQIYAYVDLGTSPHIIKSRRPGGRLRFFGSGFKPKSRVGYIASYAGRRADKDLRFPKIVHHPGTKARRFSETIQLKWEKKWATRMRQAIRNASL